MPNPKRSDEFEPDTCRFPGTKRRKLVRLLTVAWSLYKIKKIERIETNTHSGWALWHDGKI